MNSNPQNSGLDKMTSRGPFQPQPFCDSLKWESESYFLFTVCHC